MSVIIGMDPHKRSATIEVIDQAARILAGGRYGTDKTGYAELLAAGRKFPERVWAVEGCNGIGKHLAHRLVHEGSHERAFLAHCGRRAAGVQPPRTEGPWATAH